MNFKKIKLFTRSLPGIRQFYDRFLKESRYQNYLTKLRAEMKNDGLSLIKKITAELDKSNVRFFVDFGTLLGLIREGGFIAHDLDMDFGIYINEDFTWDDLEKALKACGLKKQREFVYNGVITEQAYINKLLTIDFFNHTDTDSSNDAYVYYKLKDREYEENSFSVIKLIMYKFGDIERVEINGTLIPVPSNAEKYLESIYTENWRIPDPNWKPENGPAWNEVKDALAECRYFDY